MADDNGLFLAQRTDQLGDIADQMKQGIGLDRCRGVGAAVAAHVGGRDPISCRRQRADLVAPGMP